MKQQSVVRLARFSRIHSVLVDFKEHWPQGLIFTPGNACQAVYYEADKIRKFPINEYWANL